MAATSTQTLFTEAECFACIGAVGPAQTMRIALFSRILESLGVTMTIQELINVGKCFGCIPGISLADQIELVLIDQISQGSLGGSQITRGSGPPVAAPADPTHGAEYYDDDSASPSYETEWKWSVPEQKWIGT
jgi:hypothetical protein